ncbi:hypothetical protein CANCADRAFT_4104 [Tortispora caseinolytica NRRL Y-17796]|uniref:Brix domain-containing protein n=1 Tax=Tortispora caseinolytica NRRL Y-17796 TaxID=767744 RepID=A0A1E4TCN8_9ASCO|nr:hypothetical protein CANCADRAFT_4104 [Tortispora caseinolytica NRRL Y-17796]
MGKTDRIANKEKRQKEYVKAKVEKSSSKHKMRAARMKYELDHPEAKAERLANNVPETIESKRIYDETMEEPVEDESDTFSSYFDGRPPKVLITTSKKAKKEGYLLGEQLVDVLPNSEFMKRSLKYEIKDIAKTATKQNYTDILVLNEDKKKVNGVTFIHLPEGPTMYFSLTSLKLTEEIRNHGRATSHVPELIMNNFSTRLGKTVGRMFQSLFPQQPNFFGRQVVTLHNQRDYVFFRRHRYIFRNEEKVGLQELGPQFTLKLKRVQQGIKQELEWERTAKMDVDKKQFYL